MIKVGIKGEKESVVNATNTAKAMGSGDLDVFATPCMVALMEGTANDSLKDFLEEGQGTVGTLVNIKHVAATPLNMKVCAKSELIEVDGKRLVFNIQAFDEAGLIGEGTHERFIIANEKFMQRVNSKSSSN